jgi:hypothetical protein
MGGALLAVLVLDLTEPASHEALPKSTPIFFVMNKTDLADQIRVADDDIRKFTTEHDFPVFADRCRHWRWN